MPPSEAKFADDAKRAFAYALQEAYRMGYECIQTPHLVIGLTKVEDGCTARALRQQGFEPKTVRDALRAAMNPAGPPRSGPAEISPNTMSPRVRSIVLTAIQEAQATGVPAVSERHLLIGFLKVQGSGTARFLTDLGLNLEDLLALVQAQTPTDSGSAAPTPLLDRLGRDLNHEAQQGKLKKVIGRHREMRRIAQVLARSAKNAPLLLGEAGVGKTAIVEGLAQRIVENRVPAHLRGKRIIELPVAAMVAGTKYRGDLEQRLTQLVREASQPDVILFIDEIHTLIGAGQGEGGTLDAASILKPALARGDIRCIAATTPAEFRKTIEKDPALERRFQPVKVEEPSSAETLEILCQTRQHYETFYGVRVLNEALEAAVSLSVTYLPGRRLPDKACDLIDEACVRAIVGSASEWSEQQPTQPQAAPVITVESVAQVVTEWTGIPVARLTETEHLRLLKLEELLRQRVIGQDEAVTIVAQAVRLGRTGLKKPNRPVGVFLFIGPTGVGKTELAKALAETVFGSERDMLRLDMSEFGEAHSIGKLIGAPPGYIGYEQEGQLTGPLREKPYAVVLFDEIEKAHPHVFDLLLQLFDDGRITDGQGRTADGSHAIFIMTSNAARELIEERQKMGFLPEVVRGDESRLKVMADLHRIFRAEFLNRIDEVVVFQHLQPEHIKTIGRLQLGQLVDRVKGQSGTALAIEEDALQFICEQGYSREEGARALQRTIERLVAKPLSDLLLRTTPGKVTVRAENGKIILVPG